MSVDWTPAARGVNLPTSPSALAQAGQHAAGAEATIKDAAHEPEPKKSDVSGNPQNTSGRRRLRHAVSAKKRREIAAKRDAAHGTARNGGDDRGAAAHDHVSSQEETSNDPTIQRADVQQMQTSTAHCKPATVRQEPTRGTNATLQGCFDTPQVDQRGLKAVEELHACLEHHAPVQLKARPSGMPAVGLAAAKDAPPGLSCVTDTNADKRARKAFAAANMDMTLGPRPQDNFQSPVDNSNTPFQPRLDHWASFQVSKETCQVLCDVE